MLGAIQDCLKTFYVVFAFCFALFLGAFKGTPDLSFVFFSPFLEEPQVPRSPFCLFFSISWGIWRWVSFVFFWFLILVWFWGWVFSWILIFPLYCSSFGGSCCCFVDDSWECCSYFGAVSRSCCLDCLCSCEVRIALGPPFICYSLNLDFRILVLNWLFKFIKNVLVLKNHSSLHLCLHFQHLCKIYGYVGVIGCRKFANYMILKRYIIYASLFRLMILF